MKEDQRKKTFCSVHLASASWVGFTTRLGIVTFATANLWFNLGWIGISTTKFTAVAVALAAGLSGLCHSNELVDDSQKDEEDHQSHHNLNFNKQNNENQIIFYIEFAIWHVALNFKK